MSKEKEQKGKNHSMPLLWIQTEKRFGGEIICNDCHKVLGHLGLL